MGPYKEVSWDDDKDKFIWKKQAKMNQHITCVLLGDSNAWKGNSSHKTSSLCIGNYSFNNNGKKLLDICQQANIISNYFHTLQAHDGLGDTL